MMFRKSGNQEIRKSGNQGIPPTYRFQQHRTAQVRTSSFCHRHPPKGVRGTFGAASHLNTFRRNPFGTTLSEGIPLGQHPCAAESGINTFLKRVIRAVLALFIIIPNFALAQKMGHIDSEYVLNKMPEYAEKKGEIDQLAKDYQKEVQGMLSEVEAMRADLRAKEVLYTAEMKKEREVEIEKKAQEALEKQTKFFGFDGLLFKKQEELLKPFLQKLWEAVESVARQKKLDYILDKASDVGIIYSNPVHDYTEYVLEELGLLEKEN